MDRAHVPVPEAVGHPEDRVKAIGKGGKGADRDEGVHVRLKVEEAEDPVLEVMPEKKEGWHSEKSMQEHVQEGVLLPLEEGGEGDSDHRPHRDVHQEKKEDNAGDKFSEFLVKTAFLRF